MTKLKIDLKTGVLEVEGEEAFVKEVYQDYKDQLGAKEFNSENHSEDVLNEIPEVQNSGSGKTKTVKKKNGKWNAVAIAEYLKIDSRTVRKHLKDLENE